VSKAENCAAVHQDLSVGVTVILIWQHNSTSPTKKNTSALNMFQLCTPVVKLLGKAPVCSSQYCI